MVEISGMWFDSVDICHVVLLRPNVHWIRSPGRIVQTVSIWPTKKTGKLSRHLVGLLMIMIQSHDPLQLEEDLHKWWFQINWISTWAFRRWPKTLESRFPVLIHLCCALVLLAKGWFLTNPGCRQIVTYMDITPRIDLSWLQILCANFVIVLNVNTVGYELKLMVSDLPFLLDGIYTCHRSASNRFGCIACHFWAQIFVAWLNPGVQFWRHAHADQTIFLNSLRRRSGDIYGCLASRLFISYSRSRASWPRSSSSSAHSTPTTSQLYSSTLFSYKATPPTSMASLSLEKTAYAYVHLCLAVSAPARVFF